MKKNVNFKLGDPVISLGKMERTCHTRTPCSNTVWWRARTCQPVAGIYIGYRYLRNGILVHSPKAEAYLSCTHTTRVALIVTSERTNPIYVPFSHLKPGDPE